MLAVQLLGLLKIGLQVSIPDAAIHPSDVLNSRCAANDLAKSIALFEHVGMKAAVHQWVCPSWPLPVCEGALSVVPCTST